MLDKLFGITPCTFFLPFEFRPYFHACLTSIKFTPPCFRLVCSDSSINHLVVLFSYVLLICVSLVLNLGNKININNLFKKKKKEHLTCLVCLELK